MGYAVVKEDHTFIFGWDDLEVFFKVNIQAFSHFLRLQHHIVGVARTALVHGDLTTFMPSHRKLKSKSSHNY